MSKLDELKVSVIIPCYNAEHKILKCLNSLEQMNFSYNHYEVLFIDDYSTDKTIEVIQARLKKNQNWFIHQLKENSGSPSKPRNIGIKQAKGEYLFFLDCDDEILPDALQQLYALAKKNDACIIRGYLIVDNNGEQIIFNRLHNFPKNKNKNKNKIIEIITNQSTTPPALIKKVVLLNNNILWNNDIRMGEDTLFLLDVLLASKNIFYLDEPIYIYNKSINGNPSSTQTYGQRELKNHLQVWQEAEIKLKELNLSYFKIRGQVALQTVFQSIIDFYAGDGDIDKKQFHKFSEFINTHTETVTQFKLNARFYKALNYLLDANYNDFFRMLKPRLLIAGMDLKFILAIIPDLEKYYNIKIDEWTGHETHNEKQSKELLNWADIIFCEWLLGNAVWYSQHKLPHQKLFIRMHRFELTTDYGHQVKDSNVNAYITVGLYTLEKMIETFNYNRGKVILIPNFIDVKSYQTSNNKNKLFNIGIVGILPARKGYLNALKIIKKLIHTDKKYHLNIYGKMPKDLSWVKNDPKEMLYFNRCDDYIKENNLDKHITIHGWVDTKKALKDIGFILSVSSNEELPESFHIAPADAFASGNQGLFLHWDGVEYLYPDKYIFSSLQEMIDYIFKNSNIEDFNKNKCVGLNLIKEKYSSIRFTDSLLTTIKER